MLVGTCTGNAAFGFRARGPFVSGRPVAYRGASDRTRWGTKDSAVAQSIVDTRSVVRRRPPASAVDPTADRIDAFAGKTSVVIADRASTPRGLAPSLHRSRSRRPSAGPANKSPTEGGERP